MFLQFCTVHFWYLNVPDSSSSIIEGEVSCAPRSAYPQSRTRRRRRGTPQARLIHTTRTPREGWVVCSNRRGRHDRRPRACASAAGGDEWPRPVVARREQALRIGAALDPVTRNLPG